ncbi:hypothetical protein EIP91_000097 [Steccherinum ochraceum]|uniref:UDP-glycosyltransferases domain-containing protein n=1 Tax=Steccherinum ochraceum TaxID=92696 RepID=A0A4R0RXY7_9APHY|nr:hypothetical protein EIP91_000097 [Steccherinum ochraceum]
MLLADNYPHLVIAGVEPWGHARPLCAFASKVALTRDVYVTLFTTPRVLERVKNEVARAFGPENAERLKLIRIVALDCEYKGEVASFADRMTNDAQCYLTAFMNEYTLLAQEKPITCFVTKAEYPAVRAPTALVIDFIHGPLAKMVHNLGVGPKAKVIAFSSGMVSFMYLCVAPVERGGRGNLNEKVYREVEKSGRAVADVADEIVHDYTDEITQMPGFPKMYHYEYDPQDVSFLTKGFLGKMWMAMLDSYNDTDGVILTSPEVYEPAAVAAMKDWMTAIGRDAWAIGPLQPSSGSKEAVAGEGAQSEKSAQIKEFMDTALAKYGEQSMLYISFGSAFWVSELAKLDAFLDVVIEKNIPFILSHGSPLAQLTDEFKTRIEHSGLGLLSQWSPQQTILGHPALGWFVSHCGHGSTIEAVSSGVPLICWPFHADQPANTINLTEIHDVAYELLEVRTGPNGLKPSYRTGRVHEGTSKAIRLETRAVLEKAFGDDGKRKRANAKVLQKAILSAWDKGGPAENEMVKFLNVLG